MVRFERSCTRLGLIVVLAVQSSQPRVSFVPYFRWARHYESQELIVVKTRGERRRICKSRLPDFTAVLEHIPDLKALQWPSNSGVTPIQRSSG